MKNLKSFLLPLVFFTLGNIHLSNAQDCTHGGDFNPSRFDTVSVFGTVTFQVENILSSNQNILSTANVIYTAGNSIILNPGFHARSGSSFSTFIAPCSFTPLTPIVIEDEVPTLLKAENLHLPEQEINRIIEKITLEAQPNPFHYETQLRFQLPTEQQVSMQLFDQMGLLVQTITPTQKRAAGEYTVNLRNEQGLRGMYYVVLQTKHEQIVQKVIATY